MGQLIRIENDTAGLAIQIGNTAIIFRFQRIAKAADPDRAMIEGWVRKESLLKVSGIGLAGFRTTDSSALSPSIEVRLKDYSHLEYYLCITLGAA